MGGTKTCPECLAAVPSAAKKCQHCGSSLSKFNVGQVALTLLIVLAAAVAIIVIWNLSPSGQFDPKF